jgi:hypothetical protein
MRTAIRVVAVFVLAGSTAAWADDPPDRSPATSVPSLFEIALLDGSRVRVEILDPSVTVATRYGKLTVPVGELRQIDPGFRYPDGFEARIEEEIERLGSPSFRDREAAEKALLGFKEYALPALRRAVKSDDPEQARRAGAVIERLTDTLPEERLHLKELDTVKIVDFTVVGKLEQSALRVRSRQFGEATLRLDQLRSARSLVIGSISASLILDAAKYARPGWTTWMDTEVDVSADTRVDVTVSGRIDQWIQTPGQYMAGPDGTQAVAPGQPKPGADAGATRRWMSGSVIGRIGANGDPFVIGERYREARAPATGRLYLIIAPSNWNNDSVGTYRVRIHVGD